MLGAVINGEEFNGGVVCGMDSDVGQGREKELSGSFLAPGTAKVWPLFQRLDSGIHFADGCLPVVRMVVSEVIADALQVHGGGWRPADSHFYERNICSRRASISSCSMNSPRSACGIPSLTAA